MFLNSILVYYLPLIRYARGCLGWLFFFTRLSQVSKCLKQEIPVRPSDRKTFLNQEEAGRKSRCYISKPGLKETGWDVEMNQPARGYSRRTNRA